MSCEARVRELVAICFGVPVGSIDSETGRDQIDGWDSLGQLNLMLTIEETFDVRLGLEDMQQLASVGEIVAFLET